MRLLRLELDEFRLYHHLDLVIPAAGLRLYGANASGKTSLLESIHLLATTRSPRSSLERELINWESNQEYGLAPFARVTAGASMEDGFEQQIELTLTTDPNRPNAVRKRAKVDGRARRISDLVGTLKVVLFSPEDLSLVLGSPSIRRRYLDITISQLDRTYLRALGRYSKLVERRNSLLKDLGGRPAGRSVDAELAYWNEEFTTYAAYVIAARFRHVAGLASGTSAAFQQLNGSTLDLRLEYAATVKLPEPQIARIVEASIEEAQPVVARAIERQLRERQGEELRRGSTVIGPHRDDFAYLVGGRDLSAFGSRGQQRLAVVATKLAELKRVVDVTGEAPVLLLDDVLSELDPAHQDGLMAVIGEAGCQVIVTAIARDLLEHVALKSLPVARVDQGHIEIEGDVQLS